MLEKYESIIWDWNGTLLNDVQLCLDIVNEMLQLHEQQALDMERYKEVFGFPIEDYYRRIGMDFQRQSFEALNRRFIGQYLKEVVLCELHLDAVQVLKGFQIQKRRQFILTAARKSAVLPLLERYQIHGFFEEVEGLDNDHAASKVHRGHQLIQTQQIQPQNGVLIGDTLHDFEVAESLGLDCILIANGHQSKRRLSQKIGSGARVLEDIRDLLA